MFEKNQTLQNVTIIIEKQKSETKITKIKRFFFKTLKK